MRKPFIILAVLVGICAWLSSSGIRANAAAAATPIVLENLKEGTSAWRLTRPATNRQIEGYASLASVNRGGRISLFVNTADTSFTLQVFRMGWYAGLGGRSVLGPITLPGTRQTTPGPDANGMVECRWINPYVLDIPVNPNDPTEWCSGVYLAKLTAGTSGFQAYILFVVRDDERPSALLFQSSVTTFQAYNTWPGGTSGKSLYDYQSPSGRAVKVSFNRPYQFNTSAPEGVGAAEFLLGGDGGPPAGWECAMLRFLEREGYDVTYCTNIDTHESLNRILNHEMFLSVGHDEYWSWEMRDNVTRARNQGVSVGVFSANTCYWQVRLESSIAVDPNTGQPQPNRSLVCYRGEPDSTRSSGTRDPLALDGNPNNDNLISVRWRDGIGSREDTLNGQTSRQALPEEALIGVQYQYGNDAVQADMVIDNVSSAPWVFSGTGLRTGDRLSTLVGYECDVMQGSSPSGTVRLAHSPHSGNRFSDMTVYTVNNSNGTHPIVFATGSIQWAWGVDDWGAPEYRDSRLDTRAQQITRNILARGTGFPIANAGGPYRARAGVAVSFNGSGSTDGDGTLVAYNWDFGDGATGQGVTPLHAYANDGRYRVVLTVTDNDGKSSSYSTTATIGSYLSLWDSVPNPTRVDPDTGNIELGTRFYSEVDGFVNGVQFYKNSLNTGTHVGNLWTATGTKLANVTFQNETPSGWQYAMFSTPVRINANTMYVVSYRAPNGHYNTDSAYFQSSGRDNPPLHAPRDGASGGNGLYTYAQGAFPNLSYQSECYWVDVLFQPLDGSGGDTTPPAVSATNPGSGATNVPVSTTVTATFTEPVDPATVTGNTVTLRQASGTLVAATVTYDAATKTASLKPNTALPGSTTYTATVKGTTSGVKDPSGNAMQSNYIWSFTTTAPDITRPTVIAVSPPNGATEVATSSFVTATFSEAMDPATITGSRFELRDPSLNLVAAVVSYDAVSKIATLKPNLPLQSNTTYRAKVIGGTAGVTDLAGNALAADFVWQFKTAAFTTGFPATVPGANTATNDSNALELGVKFRSDVSGYVLGVRFHKAATNTGVHTGSLWSRDGTRMATATFMNETPSGWQEVSFAQPVRISAGTTYVASYFAPNGNYSYTSQYFAASGVDNPPLHLLQDGVDGGNGVFRYGPSAFPTDAFNATNFWVDVVFSTTAPVDTTPPTVTSVAPAANATDVGASATVLAFFSEALDSTSISSSTFELRNAAGNLVTASVAYDSATSRATLTPNTALSFGATYTARVRGGASGVKDLASNAMVSDFSWSFTTTNPKFISIWEGAAPVASTATNDGRAIELGVKFRSDVSGYVLGVRFHKAATNTGVHTGSLWMRDGTRLATATFTNETPSGWQEVRFTQPVRINAGTTYVASYHTQNGNYSYSSGYFTNAGKDNPPLRALRDGLDGGNGVFRYGDGGFPDSSWNATNYWADVVFTTILPDDTTAPTVTEVLPVGGSAGVPIIASVKATFSEAMDAARLTGTNFLLRNSAGNLVPASVTYDALTNVATLMPASALAFNTTYSATVKGGATGVADVAGNPLAADYTWTFTTVADSGAVTLFGGAAPNANIATNDGNAVELGLKFRADRDGYVKGVRFYKGSTNTGAHTGSLWSATGQLLATVPFANESASGWQEVRFAQPVRILANTTYVVSYHTNIGNYAYSGGFFAANGISNPPLSALRDGQEGGNGVFRYGPSGFPSESYNATSYWVDVVFSTVP